MNLLLVVACLGVAYSFDFVRKKADDLDVIEIGGGVRTPTESGEPVNFLLVGTDNSEGIDPDDPILADRSQGSRLADVIMILRVDPEAERASLISIPRDSWLPVAPRWSTTKINSALSGPNGEEDLIATIRHNFGISIDHYAEVGFFGFRRIVDVLGGVPIYLEHPVRDRNTGLFLTETGCIDILPGQALAYVRSRHFQYQDSDTYDPNGRWISDSSSDLGRISRQQDFIQRAAEKAISLGLRDPIAAFGLIEAGLGAMLVDENLTLGQIQDLIGEFRAFSVDSLEKYQLPTTGNNGGNVSYQKIDFLAAEPMLDVFRGADLRDEVDTLSERKIIVDVAGEGDDIPVLADAIETHGFDVDTPMTRSTPERGDVSTIRFGLKGTDAARVLAAYLDGPVELEFDPDLPGRRLQLVPAEFGLSIRDERIDPSSIAPPELPEGEDGDQTSVEGDDPDGESLDEGDVDATGTSTTTTTEPIGIVPIDADASERCG